MHAEVYRRLSVIYVFIYLLLNSNSPCLFSVGGPGNSSAVVPDYLKAALTPQRSKRSFLPHSSFGYQNNLLSKVAFTLIIQATD